jgi:hypothetical protein
MPKNYPDYILMDIDDFRQMMMEDEIYRIVDTIIIENEPVENYKDFHYKAHMGYLLSLDMAQRKHGFERLTYNLVIFPDGMIGYCRPLDMIPGGIGRDHSYDLSICVAGNFNKDGDDMSKEQESVLTEVVAYLCKKLDMTPDSEHITYANWYNLATGQIDNKTGLLNEYHKTSPGTAFFGGLSVEQATLGFIPLVQVKYKLNKLKSPERLSSKKVKKAVVISDSLRVRDLPESEGKTLSILHRGTIIPVYENIQGWVRIARKQSRWLSERFVEMLPID